DGSQYVKIYNANKSTMSNPNVLYVGQVLTIP
ncbi:MAG: LysM peptidoglycan-binding domain-containing protein, partial [Clostridia bacterium]|nr:LysM peptidoglycan-binding domain-containing protein [Clostridia bacterium]